MLIIFLGIGIVVGLFFFCRKIFAIATKKEGIRYCFDIFFLFLGIVFLVLSIFVMEKIGESFPIYWKTTSQKEFLDCGIVIETQDAHFLKWQHNFLGFPNKEGIRRINVCRSLNINSQ